MFYYCFCILLCVLVALLFCLLLFEYMSSAVRKWSDRNNLRGKGFLWFNSSRIQLVDHSENSKVLVGQIKPVSQPVVREKRQIDACVQLSFSFYFQSGIQAQEVGWATIEVCHPISR